MKKGLQLMLNEFIDREFAVDEMLDVLYCLNDMEEYRHIQDIYRKREMYRELIHYQKEEDGARFMANKTLRKYNLEYEIDELI